MHQIFESIKLAIASLVASKLRAILTLLGMVIAVMTVIAVVSVINGMNKSVSEAIGQLGSTTFFIDKYGLVTSQEQWYKVRKRKDLIKGDMAAIDEFCGNCQHVGASSSPRSMTIKRGNDKIGGTTVNGVTYNYFEIATTDIERGRSFTESDELHRRSVCVVGSDVTEHLFPFTDPIGQKIKIGRYYFTIIGVGKPQGSILGANQDNWAITPLSTYSKYFSRGGSLQIFVKAAEYTKMDEAMDEARSILRARRHVKYSEPDDFEFFTSESVMEIYNSFTQLAWLVLIGVSSISLVVGGIVIMNIMLVSVTERTREVGIRKALGARRKDILWQFLIEALTLSIIGGLIGIAFGSAIAKIIAAFTPLPSSVETWSIVTGVLISSVIGIFFGIYPAMKAARMDPIDALRYE